MTARRRQGSGRKAIDHIAAGLSEALGNLSKTTAAQASIGWAVQDQPALVAEALERLDDDQLQAVADAAGLVQATARELLTQDDGTEGGAPCSPTS